MTSTPALRALADRLGDRLLLPGDAGYDDARTPWNLAVEQHPAAVARPADVDELRALLDAARADGLQLAIQPGGHGASGSLEGAVLVRTAAFDGIWVDAAERVARVGAGVRWGEVLEALEGTGLVALAGSSRVVHTVPFVLAGGHSWFSRAFGLGSASVRAVELLTADGRHRWVSDDDDPELMRALRGAGGAFGVVTAVEIELFPARELVGGRIVFDGADLGPVLHAALAAQESAPDTVAVHASALRVPDVEAAPPALRGRTIVTVQAVSIDGAEVLDDVLAPVRAAGGVQLDTIAPIGIEQLAAVADEPTDPSAGYSWARFADLGPAELDALIAAWQGPAGGAVMLFEFRGLGGAIAAPPARPAISGSVPQRHVLSARAIAVPGIEPAVQAGFAAIREALGEAVADRTFGTFLEAEPSYAGAYEADELARAESLRRTIDPEGRFRGNRDFG
ncbi:FAD-binding oxidoreductase [Agromyces soli]